MHPFCVFVIVFIASDLPIFISSAPRFQEGDIRLLGGRTRYEGTVLIYHNGEWGSICDRSWGRRDANVACRQLGYTRAMQSARGSRYGIGRNRRWMTRLRCRGSERRLDKCQFGEWGIRNDLRYCSARRRSAGVRCYPARMTRRRRPVTRAPRRRPVTSTPRPVTVRSTLKSTTITSTRPTTTPTTTTEKDKTTTNSGRRIVKTTKTPNEIPKSIISSTRRPVTSTPRPVIVRSTLKPTTIPSTRPTPKYKITTENNKATTNIYRGMVQTIKTTPAEIINNIISSVVEAPAPQGPPVLTGSLADPDPPGSPGPPGQPGTNEDILNNNIPSPQQPYSFVSSSSSRSNTDVVQTLSPLSNHIQVLGTNSSNNGRREQNINTTLIHIAENNNIVVDLPETGTTPLTVSDTITPIPVETPDEKNDINNSPVQSLTTTENISPETELRESSSATSETMPSYLNITLSPSTSIRTTVSFLTTTSSPRKETTTEKTTPSTSNVNVNGQNPDLVQNKWIKDKLLNAFVFLSRRGKILVSKDGGRPEQMTIAQYINKRREVILSTLSDINDIQSDSHSNNEGSNTVNDDQDRISGDTESIVYIDTGNEEGKVGIRLMGGRHSLDGRVEVLPPGGGRWGVICADKWTMKEAIVACRHLRKSYAQQPIKMDHYGGSDQMKYYSSVECSGREKSLQDCKWREHDGPVTCSTPKSVAGVVCTRALPDLEPDIYMLETSVSLQDRHLYYLQCAMEEKCLAPSAYRVQGSRGWRHATRRLMRFSSVVKNIGTADFKPISDRSQWEWHACHMHYHSMEVFAHYDILDNNGNRVAEGLKASFCLEDSACNPGIYPKYSCQNYGQQGISVGCSDNYMSDIDCQWIDITDLKPGKYTFKLEINPNLYVAETSFENNVIVCDLTYTGYYARIFNCNLKSLL